MHKKQRNTRVIGYTGGKSWKETVLYVKYKTDLHCKTIFQGDGLVSELCCCTKKDKSANPLEYIKNKTRQEKMSSAEENNFPTSSKFPNEKSKNHLASNVEVILK